MACLNSKAQKEKGIASQPASEDRGVGGGGWRNSKSFVRPEV